MALIGAEILDSVGADINKSYQNVCRNLRSFLPLQYLIVSTMNCERQEEWNALQFTCSVGDAEVAKTLLSDGANADWQTKVTSRRSWQISCTLTVLCCIQSKVIPQVTALHIACRYGHLETVKSLITHADVNKQDQVS